MYHLNLDDHKNQILSNLLSPEDSMSLQRQIDDLGIIRHFALFSSGTTGGALKGYLISQEALLSNAQAVNERLGLTVHDRWGLSLPHYHIGGLSIFFRAHLLGHAPINLRPWSPEFFVSQITHERISILSLVPTQLFDLVSLKLRSPESLKTVLIGGDFLGQELELRARELGWPLVRTFGMSEVSSQLCTGESEDGYLKPLPIHEISVGEQQQLLVKSTSLFSYLIKRESENWVITSVDNFFDSNGYLPLQDRVEIRNGQLRHLGRLDEGFKVSGHLVDLTAIREALEKLTLENNVWGEMDVKLLSDPRRGKSLVLLHTKKVSAEVIEIFLQRIAPVRIEQIISQENFNRTELGKTKWQI